MVHLRGRIDPRWIEHAFERWCLCWREAVAELIRHPTDVGAEIAHSTSEAPKHLIQHQENRHLHQKGQTAPQRVDAVFLVELQKFFVEFRSIVFVPGLNLLHFRLELLHHHHRPRALEGQRRDDDHHHQCQEDDGNGIVPGDVVEERQH